MGRKHIAKAVPKRKRSAPEEAAAQEASYNYFLQHQDSSSSPSSNKEGKEQREPYLGTATARTTSKPDNICELLEAPLTAIEHLEAEQAEQAKSSQL